MQYHYEENGESKGPFSIEELKTKNITKQTLVWAEGMADWVPAGTVEALNDLFVGQVPPVAEPAASASSANVPPQQPAGAMPPKNYLVESILVTLFCCMPFGVVGIINASKVNSLFLSGNVAAAEAAANDAKKWSKIGGIIGLVGMIGYIIFIAMAGLMGSY